MQYWTLCYPNPCPLTSCYLCFFPTLAICGVSEVGSLSPRGLFALAVFSVWNTSLQIPVFSRVSSKSFLKHTGRGFVIPFPKLHPLQHQTHPALSLSPFNTPRGFLILPIVLASLVAVSTLQSQCTQDYDWPKQEPYKSLFYECTGRSRPLPSSSLWCRSGCVWVLVLVPRR